jgi:tetratricopeptide (TPR) repeat protein
MRHSTFLKSSVSTEQTTTPHLSLPGVELSPVYPYHRAHAPSGSLHSSVNELSHWAIANLNGGVFEDKKIWQPGSQKLLWKPVIAWSDDDPDEYEALSWFMGSYKGVQTYSHSGGDVGFCTYLLLIPEKSLAVIVLANTFPAPVKEISNSIIDLLLGNETEPLKPPVMVALSQVLKGRGPLAAFDVYCQLVEDLPNQFDAGPEQFCDIAYILIEIKRIPEAMRVLELAKKIHPHTDDVYNMLAFASYTEGKCWRAIQYARHCLELNPKNSDAEALLTKCKRFEGG